METRTKISITVLGGVIVVFVAIFFFVLSRKDIQNSTMPSVQEADKGRETVESALRVEPPAVTIGRGEVQSIKVYLGKSDVTDQVVWEPRDPDVATITNPQNNAGFVQAFKEGTTSVIASYREKTIKVDIEVVKISLVSHCYPSVEKAKVGEEVKWVLAYEKFGVPPYTYEWRGDVQGNEAIAYSTFAEPGMKKTRAVTIDTAGTKSDAECSIEISQE